MNNALRSALIRGSLFLVFALAALFLLNLVVFLLSRPADPISPDSCSRIAPGMTMAQAEAVLGVPPTQTFDNGEGTPYIWRGSEGRIVVSVDLEGRVVGATWVGADDRRVEDEQVEVGVGQGGQDWFPTPLRGPTVEASPLAIPLPKTFGEIFPGDDGPSDV